MSTAPGQEPPPSEGTPSHPSVPAWLVPGICIGLAVITFAIFGQTLGHDFVNYDDDEYVTDNPAVIEGLTFKGIIWAFTQTHSANWHPLTWISHMLDCELYGLHPAGHHLTNVLLHTATVIALFLVLRQMTGALWRSAFVAAIFAIHPLRVESVAWIAERKDVLSGLFFMLTIGAYTRYVRQNRAKGPYVLVVLFFTLGLLSKPMLVTLPLVLLLLDYWPLQRREAVGKLVLEKLPLLALSTLSCVATLWAQREAVSSVELFPLPRRLLNAVTASGTYLVQMVYPAKLAVFYPFPSHGISIIAAAMTVALMGVISFMVFSDRKIKPWLLVGWVWYLVMLLPVVGIIQVGLQAHADRYTYLPQIGIYLGLTWLVADWVAKHGVPREIVGGGMATVIGVSMACAWIQTGYWKNSETLWNHALACTTDNYIADLNLGNILRKKGRIDEAIVLYEKALKNKPAFAEAHFNLGNALGQAGKMDDAVIHYQDALAIAPGFIQDRLTLAVALLMQGKASQALPHFQTLLETKPNDATLHFDLGICCFQTGRMAEAIRQYERALQLKPGDAEIQNNLAWLLATCPDASLRNGNKAVELARQVNVATGGENPMALSTLAAGLAESGRFPEAMETVEHALRLAETKSQTGLAGQLQSQLKLYRAGQPFHQAP